IEGTQADYQGRSQEIYRGDPARSVRVKNYLLRARVYVDAGGGQRVQVELELRRHRADVARRLRYLEGGPRQNQRGLRQEFEADESAARSVLSKGDQRISTFMAQRRCGGSEKRNSRAGLQHGSRIFRPI